MSTLKAETSPAAPPQKVADTSDIHRRGGMLLAVTAVTVAIVGLVLAKRQQRSQKPTPKPETKEKG